MDSEAWPAPRRIGGYDLLGRVANTRTGSVWRGRDPALGRYVALKEVSTAAVQSVERLRAEARLLAHLSHPNIVGVVDLIETPGQLWLVEEWVEGATLPAVLQTVGRLSPVQAVAVVRGALLGLGYAHSRQIVHGDVSPANMLFDLHGTTKLVDFGLARLVGVPGVSGTPGYLSPEAARGMALQPASDVYSAAAVLALLLRGRPVFAGPTPESVLAAQFRGGAPDLSGIASPIGAVLHAALAPSAAQRPSDASHLLALLDQAADQSFGAGWLARSSVAGLVSATLTAGGALSAGLANQPVPLAGTPMPRPGGTLDRARRLTRARRVLATAATAAVVAAAAAVVVWHQHSRTHPQATVAAGATNGVRSPVQATAFDLRTVDWNNSTVPGSACFQKHDIRLQDGHASLPIPSATLPGGYVLDINLQPTYGKLAAGPAVAVFGLMCAGTGSYAGTGLHTRWQAIAVYGAVGGHAKLLGLYRPGELGKIGSSFLVPRGVRVAGGAIVASGDYLRGSDGACCPSGRGATTITYRNGSLVTGPVVVGAPAATAPAPATTPAPPLSSPPAPAVGRTITATGYSGRTYVATVRAEDTVTDCAAHSYGTPMISFFRRHPCPNGAGRRLVTIPFHGRTLALSMIQVDAQAGPRSNRDYWSTKLAQLEAAPGTGGLDDLLRSGVRPAGFPAIIPAHEAFVVTGQDASIEIFDAWYLDGPTADQDPDLVQLAHDIFLTRITVGPF